MVRAGQLRVRGQMGWVGRCSGWMLGLTWVRPDECGPGPVAGPARSSELTCLVWATSGKLAAAHAAKPPSRSVALIRPSLCKVAAAKLD